MSKTRIWKHKRGTQYTLSKFLEIKIKYLFVNDINL